MKLIIVFIPLLIFLPCKSNSPEPQKGTATIKISGIKDSCYYLGNSGKPIEAFRKVEILENTMTDTIVLGYAVVYPGYVGEFPYLRMDGRVDAAIDPETPEKFWPKTKMFCVNLYQRKVVQGELTIKYSY